MRAFTSGKQEPIVLAIAETATLMSSSLERGEGMSVAAPPPADIARCIGDGDAQCTRCLRREPAQRYSSAEELRDALEQLVPGAHRDEIPEGNPYRGLLAFEAQHRALFFGRKSEIGTLIDRLRTESFLLVAADSGVDSAIALGLAPHVVIGDLDSISEAGLRRVRE